MVFEQTAYWDQIIIFRFRLAFLARKTINRSLEIDAEGGKKVEGSASGQVGMSGGAAEESEDERVRKVGRDVGKRGGGTRGEKLFVTFCLVSRSDAYVRGDQKGKGYTRVTPK